jgi:hypothetical protein
LGDGTAMAGVCGKYSFHIFSEDAIWKDSKKVNFQVKSAANQDFDLLGVYKDDILE